MPYARGSTPSVSIVIPVFEKLAFTRQCLDRIERHTSAQIGFEVIVVDNGSADGTREYFESDATPPFPLRYVCEHRNLGYARANNIGAALSTSAYLLLLNNDTLVQPGWLDEMVALAESDPAIGIVGIKQLFPYTTRVHHAGIVFTAGSRPVHIHPNADASLPYVNRQRDYQAVNGACLLIDRALYAECGGLDEEYRNGYEDIDLCLKVAQRGRRIVCCTNSFIYHYGQVSETRTDDDRENEARFLARWRGKVTIDEPDFIRADALEAPARRTASQASRVPRLADDAVYLADGVSKPSAFAWFNAELAVALRQRGVDVHLPPGAIGPGVETPRRRQLEAMRLAAPPLGGVQIKWSHYWPEHLHRELAGSLNLELFAINYAFPHAGGEPWDYWLQCLAQNGTVKLALSAFCRDVLLQVGVAESDCAVLHPGYAPEIGSASRRTRTSTGEFRFLTVTNSHDLERYGTLDLLDTYWRTFGPSDRVTLVVKDYGVSAGNTILADTIGGRSGEAPVERQASFTSKEALIELYRSCDAFVSAHRGEGFAMKVLDAMACGLPVVTPLFGGPADYCTSDNCFPVDFSVEPLTECLDTRALRITNGPAWSKPDLAHLGRQMRRVFDDPAAARAVGERARRDVGDTYTWSRTAQSLMEIVEDQRRRRRRAVKGTPDGGADLVNRSPYWLGVRVSVVIPTFNRKDQLLRTIDALDAQTILPDEFELIVVDDGSTDGTAEAIAGRRHDYSVRVHRQANRGPGEARNAGVRLARGEIVLFLGDDIVAAPRLLEAHLLAHAVNSEPGDAVLGHVDLPSDPPPTAVMTFVNGPGNRQFAYDYIPSMRSIDFRLFYTSNVSLKRRFLVDAADAGVAFDPVFRYAACEDTELAYRLASRGLRIVYAADARAVHEHRMDIDDFGAREQRAGQMSVVLYRKHPVLDALVDVRWIGEAHESLRQRVQADLTLLARMQRIDQETDRFLISLARSLEARIDGQSGADATAADSRAILHRVLDVLFDAQRTRGKVTEWYANVVDPAVVEAARTVLTVTRKLQRLERTARETDKIPVALATGVLDDVRAVEETVGTPLVPARRPMAALQDGAMAVVKRLVLSRAVFLQLRTLDAMLVERLRRGQGGWLSTYLRARNRVRRLLF